MTQITIIVVLFLAILAIAAVWLIPIRGRNPRFKFYHCKSGCTNGATYYRNMDTGEMEPVQCVYCLDAEVSRRYPHITPQQYTREELEEILS